MDGHEFLAQNAIEPVNIASVNAIAVVHHREMKNPLAVEANDCLHHVGGIVRMNQVSNDAIGLLPGIDLPFFILFM